MKIQNDPNQGNMEEFLREFAESADDWFNKRSFVIDYYRFIKDFFQPDKLRVAEWPDFQSLAERIHSFQSLAMARGNAFGRPNYPIETYRKSFDFLARGSGSEEERMRSFMSDKVNYASKYLGESAVSELVGQLFADRFVFMNRRDKEAAEFLGIKPSYARGDDFPARFSKFNAALPPLFDAYRQIVGARTNVPIGLEIDQFLSWLYETKIEKDATSNAKRYWLFAPGTGGEYWEEFYSQRIMAIGWDYLGDLNHYNSKGDIVEAMREYDNKPEKSKNNALSCFSFCKDMRPGDVVFAKKGQKEIIGWGEISSDYSFDDSRPSMKHVRRVDDWREGHWPASKNLPLKTITEVTKNSEYFSSLVGIGDERGGSVTDTSNAAAPVKTAYSIENAVEELFQEKETVRIWLDQWKSKKNLILQGAPGVGKTFVARRLAYALMGEKDDNRVKSVQFHQSYGYEDFVQGIKPVSNNGRTGFELRDGVFYNFCVEARRDDKKEYVFIIDEINRGNISRIFGELLMLIEKDKREQKYAVQLADREEGQKSFFVPDNVYILGLMNTADRSLAVVDYALRRRFRFVTIEPAFANEGFSKHMEKNCGKELADEIIQKLNELNKKIAGDTANLGPGFCVGHSYFMEVNDHDDFKNVIDFEIKPLLREYWFDQIKTAEQQIESLQINPMT